MQDSLMNEGLMLMVFGMGFVFVFLTVLVIATTGMSKLVSRWAPVPAKPEAAPRAPAPAAQDDDLMVVISTAVHRYRQRHHR
ncbi:OadG family protein [Onishia niordana]|uniref:OadG family protein n=1 Tax=Onishia niordana TaxID=2508711 RepID=UPI00109FE9C1|nr:OadG family protein [Halomonas niordiana]